MSYISSVKVRTNGLINKNFLGNVNVECIDQARPSIRNIFSQDFFPSLNGGGSGSSRAVVHLLAEPCLWKYFIKAKLMLWFFKHCLRDFRLQFTNRICFMAKILPDTESAECADRKLRHRRVGTWKLSPPSTFVISGLHVTPPPSQRASE